MDANSDDTPAFGHDDLGQVITVFETVVQDRLVDDCWDRFITSQPSGEHVQSSSWARLKATEGWRVIRIEVAGGDELRGGAQMFIREIPVLGSFAYVPKGPVCLDLKAASAIVFRIERIASNDRIHHLTIQPPGEERTLRRSSNNADSTERPCRWRRQQPSFSIWMLPKTS